MNEIYHYGMPRRSGRYPYGSGEEPFQHESNFLKNLNELKEKGLTDDEIRKAFNMSTTEYRKTKSVELASYHQDEDEYIRKLKEKGYSNQAIADKLPGNHDEGYVRNRLKDDVQKKAKVIDDSANFIKGELERNPYVDVGPGTEASMGIASTKLKSTLKKLEDEGYVVEQLHFQQVADKSKSTTVTVITKPGKTKAEMYDDIYNNGAQIGVIGGVKGVDNGKTVLGIKEPSSVSSKRIFVRYNEDGGKDKDGVIELRRGVEDLSLGGAHYAQVRIAVDGTHYMKGMAMYSDNIPEGYDIVYNSHRSKGTPLFNPDDQHKETVFKEMKKDAKGNILKDNPFGTNLRYDDGQIVGQSMYIDKNGKEKLSPINIVRQEGDWDSWSKSLASQFLSKQPITLIKQQLNKSIKEKEEEFDEISNLTNPEIKKKLLDSFADDCDSSAVHLKAAALPRQASKVILPFNSIKDTEIYAPSFNDGEEVVLIRYPHGGIFEIPRLTVNNRVKEAQSVLGKNAKDAVGISALVAERLSGADFDGDTVVVIPTAGQKIRTKQPLEGLIGFDPQEKYPYKDGMKVMHKGQQTQTQMGIISNLITDMTLKGATDDELARAVRHSMVVIDAAKHKLDYRQSELDNDIKGLKEKYQTGGASTLISRAKKKIDVLDRKPAYSTNQLDEEDAKKFKEGKKVWIPTGKRYIYLKRDSNGNILYDKNGNKIYEEGDLKKISSTMMAETDDAFTLSSGTRAENEYASYANKLKALANKARKESISTKPSKVNESAKEIFAEEIESLKNKITLAEMNKPLERQAQIIANVVYKSKLEDNPAIEQDADEVKKIKQQALTQARATTGANKSDVAIKLTSREWEAIQSGAVSSSKINKIIYNMDEDYLKQLATPRENNALTNNQVARIKDYASKGFTTAEIAQKVGVSATSVNKYLE